MSAIQTGPTRGGQTPLVQSLMEEWVFGFAHQVRNPLGIIRSLAESLSESGAARKPSDRSSLQAVITAVDGLNERLGEFIEFSKPVRPFMKPVTMMEVVERATHDFAARFSKARIDLKVQVPAEMPVLLMDPEHLHTILVNLLNNAVEAMPNGGRLEVSAKYEIGPQTLLLRVRDQGKGIPREHLKEVGKPFFTTKTGAVGLGLAIIKRLLRAYEGDLTVDSTPDQGTQVSCRFHAKKGDVTAWAA